MKTPSRFNGKKYLNTIATGMSSDYRRMAQRWLLGKELREPAKALGPFRADATALAEALPATGLRVTWLGHSSTLIEVDGQRFLTDPVWSERASPSTLVGPKRFFAPPLPLAELPRLDAVILSHDHYDHLDKEAVRELGRTGVPFYCPLGVGRHLRRWGIGAGQVTELDWWQEVQVGKRHRLVATPARHFSGRTLARDNTLWASWCILGPVHRAFFGGDSGPYESGFREIGQAYGPFDVTLLEVGAYDDMWADIHMGPEHAVQAHLALRGKVLLPLHWGTFNLAFHGWTEPVERLQVAAESHGVGLLLPRPGEPAVPTGGAYNSRWWED
ncbi:MBL fold metallo-hydrolase [Hymenobacter sp. B81]|uniref:MBL fold metallo-hydrolase n=1 Tax=Hymenobacter sp. B81 TaxID=3344878 RepID=UPI0037DC4E93